MTLAPYLAKLETDALAPDEIDAAFAVIMEGVAAHEDIKRFLTLSVPFMGDAAWIAGGAKALRARMVRVAAPENAIDVCGTGGDGAHTLNISTAVAFVVAGCGVPVAKHGNRAMSSKSGAADVLEALGVKLTGHVPTLERCLSEAGVAFLFAQNHHPAMRHVALARRELGHRTIFNLLGPLSNPAGVSRQLVGVFSEDFLTPIAGALGALGSERAWVVHGAGGLDELSCEAANRVAALERGGVRSFEVVAADAFLSTSSNSGIKGGAAPQNALALRGLLEGQAGGSDYSEVVQLNAAGALVAAGAAKTLADGAKLAFDALNEGRALEALVKLVEISRRAP
ncbi:anthranilate phosphoribosyltransferase [alpha proteobacterium U9-1i]|nr:anthranilate phosphoribosyltransferase [alpha proteobacterium U9-1i]